VRAEEALGESRRAGVARRSCRESSRRRRLLPRALGERPWHPTQSRGLPRTRALRARQVSALMTFSPSMRASALSIHHTSRRRGPGATHLQRDSSWRSGDSSAQSAADIVPTARLGRRWAASFGGHRTGNSDIFPLCVPRAFRRRFPFALQIKGGLDALRHLASGNRNSSCHASNASNSSARTKPCGRSATRISSDHI
jgi:hypothetical protein